MADQLDVDEAEPLPKSALKVLEGAVRVLGSRGLSDLSIESVCKVSGVSRATLYRYFSTKDDLIEAVFEFICVEFERGVAIEAARHRDPIARFSGIMDFLRRYSAERGLIRMFEADASFHLVFFRSHFERHRAAVQIALDPVFDWIEVQRGMVVAREVSAERLIRLQISRLIIPFDNRWEQAWASAAAFAAEMIQHWIVVHPASKATRRKRIPRGDRHPGKT